MAHEYSVEIHQYITDKIESAGKLKKEAQAQNDRETMQFYEGQLHELLAIREYLSAKVDLKTQKYY